MAESLDVAGELVTVSCDNHREELASGLWNFFQSSYAVDFVTQWGGRSILAHRLILDVFLSPEKLGPSARGAQPEKPSGSGLDRQSCLASLVEFLYTGKVTIHKGQLPNLLEAARESDFKMLVEAVELTTAKMASEEAELAIGPTVIKEEQISEDEGAPGSTEDHSDWPKEDQEIVEPTGIEPNHRTDEQGEPELATWAVKVELTPAVAGSDVQHDAGVIGSIQVDHPPTEISIPRIPNRSKNFKCDYCDKRFPQSRDLEKHTRVHTNHRPYKCRHCPKTFAYHVGLEGHLRFNHCNVPDVSLPEPHVGPRNELYHPEDDYVCSVCGKSFSQRAWLKRHMLIHTGTKDYRCHLCPKSFRYKQVLTNHIRTHGRHSRVLAEQEGATSAGVSTSADASDAEAAAANAHYSCEVCCKKMKSIKGLRLHERVHVGFKSFSCSFCAKTFRKKEHRNIHARTHTLEKA